MLVNWDIDGVVADVHVLVLRLLDEVPIEQGEEALHLGIEDLCP